MHLLRTSQKHVLKYSSRTICSTKPTKPELPAFDPSIVETEWLQWWRHLNEKEKSLDEASTSEIICLPPPNVTGNLHIGHALTVAIQDSYARWRRMCGHKVTFVPGFDHAGIATQLVVEKWLERDKHLSKKDLKPEEFKHHCAQWKNSRCEEITEQLNKLGSSLDWGKCYYTLDENFSRAVKYAFRRLFNEGHIFRDNRLVNWSPYLKSTLSDVEIETIRIEQPTRLQIPGSQNMTCEFGWLYDVNYELVGGNRHQFITVGTTRPETIPADCALAVNPGDQRYSSLIGRYCKNPLIESNIMPIIADSEVNPNLGTGVLKLTPGHDRTDFAIYCRHKHYLGDSRMSVLNLFEDNGLVNNKSPFADIRGKNRFEARDSVVGYLLSTGKLVGKKPFETSVPVCSKTGDVIEPMPKSQWFLNCKPLGQPVLKLIDEQEISLYPSFHRSFLKHWIEKTDEWCLSRQLLWGHAIPAFKVELCDPSNVNRSEYVVADDQNDVLSVVKAKFPSCDILSVEQDPDVLDTWFSSALVPLVVNGWPDKCDFNKDQPLLSLLETGHDILSFWVSRMLMLGLHFTDKLPFKSVLLHGIVRDSQGRKMSKSLGNVVDPLDVIYGKSLSDMEERVNESNLTEKEKVERRKSLKSSFPKGIPQCGADALRFSLLTADVKCQTINIDVNSIEHRRHFCNKIWQSFKFMRKAWLSETHKTILDRQDTDVRSLTVLDLWILSRLSNVTKTLNSSLRSFDFHVAVHCLYTFWWHEFCDVYLEYSKQYLPRTEHDVIVDENRRKVIARLFATIADIYLRSAAPFLPFLTEELYSTLPIVKNKDASVHRAAFPAPLICFSRPEIDCSMRKIIYIISKVRSLKKEFGIPYNKSISGLLICDETTKQIAQTFGEFLRSTAKFDFQTYDNANFNANDVVISDDRIFYLIDQDCQICVKLDEAERNVAVQILENQLNKKRKEFIFNSNRLKNYTRFKKTVAVEQEKRLTQTISDVKAEIQRLDDLYNVVAKCR